MNIAVPVDQDFANAWIAERNRLVASLAKSPPEIPFSCGDPNEQSGVDPQGLAKSTSKRLRTESQLITTSCATQFAIYCRSRGLTFHVSIRRHLGRPSSLERHSSIDAIHIGM